MAVTPTPTAISEIDDPAKIRVTLYASNQPVHAPLVETVEAGAVGRLLPKGGNEGDALIKESSDDFDVKWAAASGITPDERTKLAGIETGADKTATAVHGAAAKATPADADEFGYANSAGSWGLAKLTWANIKAELKTYFDGIYATVAQGARADAALPKAGGTLTGALVLAGAPTIDLHAATKKYADDKAGVGGGQTWQNVAASRVTLTAYQNTTGGAIAVAVTVTEATSTNAGFDVSSNGTTWLTYQGDQSGLNGMVCNAIIPAGWYYRVSRTTGTGAITVTSWLELR